MERLDQNSLYPYQSIPKKTCLGLESSPGHLRGRRALYHRAIYTTHRCLLFGTSINNNIIKKILSSVSLHSFILLWLNKTVFFPNYTWKIKSKFCTNFFRTVYIVRWNGLPRWPPGLFWMWGKNWVMELIGVLYMSKRIRAFRLKLQRKPYLNSRYLRISS